MQPSCIDLRWIQMLKKINRRLARVTNVKRATLAHSPCSVSFSFDDVPQSACHTGSRILEDRGCRGSFYVCGELTGKECATEHFHTRDDLCGLRERGHEVACHGYAHLDYQSVSLDQIRRDLDRNRAFFREMGWSEPPRNFAYPYGCVSPAVKALCGDEFASARGVQEAINESTCDLALLKSVLLSADTVTPERLDHWIEETQDRKGWLIFFTHRVVNDPGEFDCTPELLEMAVERSMSAGCTISTVGEVLEGPS